MPLPSLRLHPLRQFIGRISVRTRIVAIAIIPVIGFMANGLAFTSGETEVGHAFASSQRAAKLADASREFKVALTSLRMSAMEFAAQPSYDLVDQFRKTHEAALRSLATIEAATDPDQRAAIGILQTQVVTLQSSFTELIQAQEKLGFAESEGLHEQLTRAGSAVERIINEDLGWVADADAKKLMISLLTMRRYEVLYRQNRIEFVRQRFTDEFANFNRIFESVDGAPELRKRLSDQIQTYADTFSQWALASSRVRPWVANIARADDAGGRPYHRLRAAARPVGFGDAFGLAATHQDDHCLGRAGGGLPGPVLQLLDRPQHHPPAQ
jgi:methyl-accepting chemotaxis protein